jgi:carbon storage regulator
MGPTLSQESFDRDQKGFAMLVLTRKRSEMIQIGSDIVIKVIRTGRSTVKIGVDAPANVRVVRGELIIAAPAAAQVSVESCPFEPEGVATADCSDQFPHPHLA